MVHPMGSGQSERLGVDLNGSVRRFHIDGGNRLRKRVVQLSKAAKSRRLRPYSSRKDHSRPVHDDTGGDGRNRGEDDARHKTRRRWSRSPQGHEKKSPMARREKGNPLRRRRGSSEVLEPMDRRHGGETGRGRDIHGRPPRDGWEERRHHRRGGRFGLSRRFLNRQKMALSKPKGVVEGKEVLPQTGVGHRKQGRRLVGQQRKRPMAVKKATRTQHIQPLQASDGETPKSRHPLPSQHDGHQDRVERRAKPVRDAKLVRKWL